MYFPNKTKIHYVLTIEIPGFFPPVNDGAIIVFRLHEWMLREKWKSRKTTSGKLVRVLDDNARVAILFVKRTSCSWTAQSGFNRGPASQRLLRTSLSDFSRIDLRRTGFPSKGSAIITRVQCTQRVSTFCSKRVDFPKAMEHLSSERVITNPTVVRRVTWSRWRPNTSRSMKNRQTLRIPFDRVLFSLFAFVRRHTSVQQFLPCRACHHGF